MKAICIATFVLLVVFLSWLPANAVDTNATKIKDIPRSERLLMDGEPGVFFDDRLYKYYTDEAMHLGKGQTLIIDVLSYEFQPEIYVRRAEGEVIHWSGHGQPYTDDSGKSVYWARLEFDVPLDGDYRIITTSGKVEGAHSDISALRAEGIYAIEGAIFAAPAPSELVDLSNYKVHSRWGPDQRGGGTHHAEGTVLLDPTGAVGDCVGIVVSWIEPGDSGTEILNAGDAMNPGASVQRQEGDAYYLAPRTGADGQWQIVVIDSPNRQAAARVEIRAECQRDFDGVIAMARQMLDQAADRARDR